MENITCVPLDVDRIATIKEHLVDLKNDLQKLTCLHDAQSHGRLFDVIADARQSLFRGDESEEFQLDGAVKLGTNVHVAGSTAPFHGRYISLHSGQARSLQVKCIEADSSDWFGLEFASDSYIVDKISDIYAFIKLTTDTPINLWLVAYFSQGPETTRIDLQNMHFDRNTQYSMLSKNVSGIYDTSKGKTYLRLGCYFPTNRLFETNILDVRFLCTI
jgi:hypothetical protein